MKKNVLEYLDNSVKKYPSHIFCKEEDKEITYKETEKKSKTLGYQIIKTVGKVTNSPIIIFIDKSIDCMIAMLGVLYSGNYYVCIDRDMPNERLDAIINNLQPIAMICLKNDEKSRIIQEKHAILTIYINNEIVYPEKEIDDAIAFARKSVISTDPAYILYTSGSTGIPKGSVISHGALIAYADWLQETFNFNHETIFGSQTPFYFSMSVLDIFSTLKNGATLVLIPKKLFSFPIQLLEYLNKSKINTIYWVPSAMGIVAKWKALDYVDVTTLKTILFAGEVMPNKVLNRWREHIPNAMYANLFGPTEITDIALYYIVDREFKDEDILPIGVCANSMNAFALNENNDVITQGEIGELYFKGPFLGNGYYCLKEKTDEVFVQNPLNNKFSEKVYKTGDLVKINEFGEYEYIGRVDSQIKHSGYRIELGEIEHAANCIPDIDVCVALYDSKKDHIVLLYQGRNDSGRVLGTLREKYLPAYMLPDRIENIAKMPYNANGKIDRVKLYSEYIG